jgi:hypothetical protein
MRFFPSLRFWRLLRYRLCVGVVGLAYLLVALEIPLPVFVPKDAGQPFPCQDHPCGCQTAEQCWRGCCCFSVEERWAWARAHHVEPPAYAEKPKEPEAAHGWNTVKRRDLKRGIAASKSCCREKTERASCCRSAPERSTKEASKPNSRVRWMTTMNAWRCQGYSTVWVSAGAVLPVPPFAIRPADPIPSTSLSFSSAHADRMPSIPPDPPPRLSL